MKITESQLRSMIREVITEISGIRTVRGGIKKGDYKSPDTKTKQKAFDTADTDYKAASDTVTKSDKTFKTAQSDTATKKTALKSAESAVKALKGKEFWSRWTGPLKKGQPIPSPRYGSSLRGPLQVGYGPWAANPEVATAKTQEKTAKKAFDSAQKAEKSAKETLDKAKLTQTTKKSTYDTKKSALDTAKEKDLKKTKIPAAGEAGYQPPPATGAGAGGYGTGKSSGKGKGKGKGKKGKGKGKDDE